MHSPCISHSHGATDRFIHSPRLSKYNTRESRWVQVTCDIQVRRSLLSLPPSLLQWTCRHDPHPRSSRFRFLFYANKTGTTPPHICCSKWILKVDVVFVWLERDRTHGRQFNCVCVCVVPIYLLLGVHCRWYFWHAILLEYPRLLIFRYQGCNNSTGFPRMQWTGEWNRLTDWVLS